MKNKQKQLNAKDKTNKKQLKIIKKQLICNIEDDYKNELLISKESEIFKNIYNERLGKIEELIKKINFDNLKYFTERNGMETDFSAKDDTITFLNNIKTNNITIEEAKASLEDYNKNLKMIRKGNKTNQQKQTLSNIINILFNGRNDAIKFVEDYGSMILEAKKKQRKKQDFQLLNKCFKDYQ